MMGTKASNIDLGTIIKIYNGKPYSALRETGKFPVYGSGGLMGFTDDFMYKGEAILLPRKGTLNNIQFLNSGFWVVDTTYFAVVNKAKADTNFLWNYLKLISRHISENLNSGSAVPSMTQKTYEQIKILLPNLTTQRAIARVLSQLDEKIELNRKINAELENMAKTIYDYWFLQFDFPNADGKPYKSSGGEMVYNPTLKRDIPKGWRVSNLRKTNMCKLIKTGINHFDSEKIYLATSCLDGTEVINYSEKVTFENRPSRANMQPTKNSVWFAKMKATTKNLILNEASKEIIQNYILSTGFSGVACRENTLYYLWNYVTGEYFSKKKDLIASGATQQAINESDLIYFDILEPTEEILIKFTKLVSPMYLSININKQQNKNLAELRDFLLPMLMNGQVTVKDEKQ